jgi:Ca2+-binding EF-hand superfamily protein
MNLNTEQIDMVFDAYDINKNGLIDYSEFIASCIDTKVNELEKYLKQIFKELDKVQKG